MRRRGVLDLPSDPAQIDMPAIVICPGWGEGLWGWRRSAQLIHKSTGRRVVVIAAPGWRLLRLSRFSRPASQERLATNVRLQMNRLNLVGAIGIGHSMGGVYLQLAAITYHVRFVQLILVCPSGFIDHDSFWRLAGRLAKKAGQSIVYALTRPRLWIPTLVALLEGLLYPLRNPLALLEGIDLAKAVTVKPHANATVILASRDAIYPRDRLIIPSHMPRILIPGQHDLQYDAPRFAKLIADLV